MRIAASSFFACFMRLLSMNVKTLPTAITSYDLFKTLAVATMLIDHVGIYFFPDELWFRVIGRLSFPIWLFLETIMLTPLALGYLITLGVNGTGVFLVSMSDSLMLAGGGIATSLPLLLYVAGANRLRLGTLGTLQYISPTIAFMLGAFLYGEPLGRSMLVTFILIWFGVFLYLGQLFRDSRKMA